MRPAQQTPFLTEPHVMKTFARLPVSIERGCGMLVWDESGREYLDFIGGIGSVSLGHCRKEVAEAICAQARRLMHVGNIVHTAGREAVASKLDSLLNAGIPRERQACWKTFFANSGAEANECAIKLARLHSRKRTARRHGVDHRSIGSYPCTVLTLDGGFHGRTLTTLAATAQPEKQRPFAPLPNGFVSIPPNDLEALDAVFSSLGSELCAVMVECIQGESGVKPLDRKFAQALQALAKKHEALLVVDEIQTGLFRCGARPFAFMNLGLEADIVTMAKGMANGFPMGACSARSEIADDFEPGDHGTTFGGSPLATSAAMAALEILATPSIGANVEQSGSCLASTLSKIPQVESVRGSGLMRAAVFSAGIDARKVVERALDFGLLVNATDDRTLRFLPPLICSSEDVNGMAERLEDAISAAC